MRILNLLSLFLVFSFYNLSAQIEEKKELDYKEVSLNVLKYFQEDNIDSVYNMFDENMKQHITTNDLTGLFAKLETAYGDFVKTADFSITQRGEHKLCLLDLEFKNDKLQLQISFNEVHQIAGLFFSPIKSASDYQTVNNENIIESEIILESGKYKLPAIICKPKNLEKFDMVVLVHGSGANDKNMTAGPNMIFRDISHQLANAKIASLRYDKRTYAYRNLNPDSITLEETTIIDALAAIELACQQEGVQRVILIGHSLGAMAAPRIAERAKKLDAVIMLAANASPLNEIIIDQYKHIYSIDGLSKGEKQMIEEIKRKSKNVSKISNNTNFESKDLSLNQNQYYWNYLNNYNQLETLKAIQIPVFIAQGERDYQVDMKEFKIWQKKMKNKSNIFLKSYPKLNHLFMEGEGKSFPAEYKKKGEVASYLIDDIAIFIKTL